MALSTARPRIPQSAIAALQNRGYTDQKLTGFISTTPSGLRPQGDRSCLSSMSCCFWAGILNGSIVVDEAHVALFHTRSGPSMPRSGASSVVTWAHSLPQQSHCTTTTRFPFPPRNLVFLPRSPTLRLANRPPPAHTAKPPHREVGERAMEEDSPVTKTVKGAVTGLAAGTIWGTVVATWYDVPRVERHVALPGLIRTIKMCGSYGATFAVIGGLYIGVEQLVESQRKKRDYVNGAVGAFVAGATVCGYRGKSIQSALIAGSCLAFTSAVLDVGGNTTRVDNGKEYYPYTTEKKPAH